MRGFKILLKVKEKELLEEQKRLKDLLGKAEKLSSRERELYRYLGLLKEKKVSSVLEIGLFFETSRQVLDELTLVRKKLEDVQKLISEQRRVVAFKRGEVRAVERYLERKRREEEKREEILLERFVDEVLGSRSSS